MSPERLIELLKRLAAEHGEPLSVHRFCRLAGISDRAIYAAFPGGWPQLRAAAGLQPARGPRPRLPDAGLLWPVINFYERKRRLPTWGEIERLMPASAATYARRYGRKKGLEHTLVAFLKAEHERLLATRRSSPPAPPSESPRNEHPARQREMF